MGYCVTTPEREKVRQKKLTCTQKTASREIFSYSIKSSQENRLEASELRRKNDLTTTKVASGIPYWVNRDPIEEVLGIRPEDLSEGPHLYSYVGNNSINVIDLLGLAGGPMNFTDGRGNTFGSSGLMRGPDKRVPRKPNKPNKPGLTARPNHSNSHSVIIVTHQPVTDEQLDMIFEWLETFKHFQPNDQAFIRNSAVGKEFKLKSTPKGILAKFALNDGWFGVNVTSNDDKRVVIARTLDRHPLVGTRRWRVHKTDVCKIKIETDATAQSRNAANFWGGIFGGNADIIELWRSYMSNNAKQVEEQIGGKAQEIMANGS